MKYDAQNVKVKDGQLVMQQNGYSNLDHERFDPVHIAGMQSRATDILHGTFRTELKLDGYDGGSCASFFWYHDNNQELDIEVVTPGTSIVNNTINYTTQPSTKSDWSPIAGATLSIPLKDTLDTFRAHRFDCDAEKGVKYYLDDKLMHTDDHNVPRAGGSLQLKLWADGNKYWSGLPSSTDTFLRVKNVIAYYNTTTSSTNQEWHDKCHKEKTQCKAVMNFHDKGPAYMPDFVPDYIPGHVPGPGPMPTVTKSFAVPPTEPWYPPTACVGAMSCSTGIGARPTDDHAITWTDSTPTYTGYTLSTVSPVHNGSNTHQPGHLMVSLVTLVAAAIYMWISSRS